MATTAAASSYVVQIAELSHIEQDKDIFGSLWNHTDISQSCAVGSQACRWRLANRPDYLG